MKQSFLPCQAPVLPFMVEKNAAQIDSCLRLMGVLSSLIPIPAKVRSPPTDPDHCVTAIEVRQWVSLLIYIPLGAVICIAALIGSPTGLEDDGSLLHGKKAASGQRRRLFSLLRKMQEEVFMARAISQRRGRMPLFARIIFHAGSKKRALPLITFRPNSSASKPLPRIKLEHIMIGELSRSQNCLPTASKPISSMKICRPSNPL